MNTPYISTATLVPTRQLVWRIVFLLGALTAFSWIFLLNSWISDDAYITLRTIDNFVHGYGLRWNTAERVQTFTHPLWLFLVTSWYWFSAAPTISLYLCSYACSAVFVALLTVRWARTWGAGLCALTLLLSSTTFMTYSSSGLENPLSHLLLGVFFSYLLSVKEDSPTTRDCCILAMLAALLAANRMDLVLLCSPALAYLFIRRPRLITAAGMLLGMSPFILWIVFATFYYGFPLPNTAYAKLNTGINRADLFAQGLKYLHASARQDWMLIPSWLALCFLSISSRSRSALILCAGALLYLAYIVSIGGDYMVGRFLSPLIALAAVGLGHCRIRPIPAVILSVILILLGLQPRYPSLTLTPDFGRDFETAPAVDQHGIANEQRVYYRASNLLVTDGWREELARWGRFRTADSLPCAKYQVFVNTVGRGQYGASPCLHQIDTNALVDPLLSHLAVRGRRISRIGHFAREIPEGYVQSLESGTVAITDAELAAYYLRIKLITRGDLWDRARLQAIAEVLLGRIAVPAQYRP